MKSKSFDLELISARKNTDEKLIDFVGLYKSAAETNTSIVNRKSDGSVSKETENNKSKTLKRECSPHQNKKRHKKEVNVNLNSSVSKTCSDNITTVPSTPDTRGESQDQANRVKSIMKNKTIAEQSKENDRSNMRKKRNKSVSFMLDDSEEVSVKRSKSDESNKNNKKPKNIPKPNIENKKKTNKKFEKNQLSEKENKADMNNQNMDIDKSKPSAKVLDKKRKVAKLLAAKKLKESTSDPTLTNTNPPPDNKEQKKLKNLKRSKAKTSSEPANTESNNNEVLSDAKLKKSKKKKPIKSPIEPAEAAPAGTKTDIAEDLENLSIGDNAHSLTNLLDEMTVVDKDKRKKLRRKSNKDKRPIGPQSALNDSEKSDEVKEKVKWKKRKWNKDKKGEADDNGLANTVIVENLPIDIMLNYKKLLTELFERHGTIKKIGVAEVYPNQESKPVFTTTIQFGNDGAADQALLENNTKLEGSRIRVKQPLPATETTLVVRSYAELNDQTLSTTFVNAGKIRSIRLIVKGKHTMATAFVEFDGPDAVERAIKSAGDVKIGGKKIYLSKYEIRTKKFKKQKNDGESTADADSEDSND